VLRTILVELLSPLERPLELPDEKPCVIMLAGVNGAGKTTSLASSQSIFWSRAARCCSLAGDTFRAAARDQLVAWGERAQVAVVAQSAAMRGQLVFDAIFGCAGARHRRGDRRHGRTPADAGAPHGGAQQDQARHRQGEPGAPHETWLVLDAGTGQNAISQVTAFDDALGLTGLILTKLDGTAKGGMVWRDRAGASTEAYSAQVSRRRRERRRLASVRRR